MPPKEDELDKLFEKLDGCIQNSQYKKALKIVNDVLKAAPKDADAIKAKAVLLAKTGSFEEALKVIQQNKLQEQYSFEKAYCLYRLGKYEEAFNAVQSVGADREEAQLQLQAQLLYRLARASEATDNYLKLCSEFQVNTPEVQTNLVAAAMMAGRAAESLAQLARVKGGDTSFEAVFNKACGDIQQGNYQEAEEQLQLAIRMGQETLFEAEYSEDEVETELAPITAQLAFTWSRLGRISESIARYSELLSKDLKDETTSALVKNNLFVERLCQHTHKKLISDALKKLETIMDKSDRNKLKSDLEARLSDPQKECLHTNHALLLIMAGKLDAARSLVSWLQKKFPTSSSVKIVQATLLVHDNKLPESDSVLSAISSDDASVTLTSTLMRAQVAAQQHNYRAAMELMQGLRQGDREYKPALVASVTGLMVRVGDTEAAEKLLQDALKHWQPQKGSEARSAAMEWLLVQLIGLKLKLGDVSSASSYYKQLQQHTGQSSSVVRTLAKLARALAVAQPEAAANLEEQLPPMDVDVDAQQLETSSIGEGLRGQRSLRGLIFTSGAAPMDASGPAVDATKHKKRRKKKKRYPKGFDSENPGPMPDPERWLPKWQRSDAKKKRTRKRDKEVIKGSQGAGKVDESLDISTSSSTAAKGKAAAPPPGVAARGAGKKKKGRK